MNRISQCFAKAKSENRPVFTGYLTMGSPTLAESEQAITTMIENGVDIIEFGVPFSDPMADGAIIRLACDKALNNGTKLADILDVIAKLRAKFPETPFVLFSYYNVLYSKGLNNLGKMLSTAGIDAVLAVDVVFEDRAELLEALTLYDISLVPLIAPGTPKERITLISQGIDNSFLYVITVNGTTGERNELPNDLKERLAEVKGATHLPIVAGFGVHTRQQADLIAKVADGFVIGSAIVKIANDESDQNRNETLANFIKSISYKLGKDPT